MDSRDVAALGAGQRPATVIAGASVSIPTDAAPSRYPWQLVGLLWMVAFLNNADRAVIVAVMPAEAAAMSRPAAIAAAL